MVPEESVRGRSISTAERSGVLHPQNLERYGAGWIPSPPAVADVVADFWHVHWRFAPGEAVDQSIIAAPAVTLSIERGEVPAHLVITGVHHVAWRRRIAGSGEVFGIRLRPAGLAVVSDLTPTAIADGTIPVTPALDARLHGILSRVAEAEDPEARAEAASRILAEAVAERPIGAEQRLANAVVSHLTERVGSVSVGELTKRFGTSERGIQRALKGTIGHGPKWVSRWVRLQEVARLLSVPEAPDLGTVAAEAGYVDQAHLSNDFRTAVGMTPGAYVRSLRVLTGGGRSDGARPGG
jgi:AraC-like DNA-binding protein